MTSTETAPRIAGQPDPRLAAILAAWASLSERDRAALHSLAVGGKGKVAA